MHLHPVYIQSLASIHPQGEAEEGRFTACEPDYRTWIADAGIRRRMSRIVKMGVAAGLQCLHNADERPDAIITATGLGCLADTEKFLRSVGAQNEELLSPTPFIQSTFNTIGAQIALLSGNKAYNSTYVHRAFSFESALLDGIMQLQSGDARNVLVGAVDELTPTLFHILQRMGARRKSPAGEGASFFLLGSTKTPQSVARIVAVDMQSGDFSREQIEQKQLDFLQKNGVSEESITPVSLNVLDSPNAYKPAVTGNSIITPNLPVLYSETYKRICGEFPTASSFGLWYACTQLHGDGFILVTNSFRGNNTMVLIEKLSES